MSQQPGATANGQAARKLTVVMAQMDFLVGDIPGNAQLVIDAVRRAEQEHNADLVVFPELCLTGYPPEDLLLRPSLDLRVAEALASLQQASLTAACVIGAPIRMVGCFITPPFSLIRGRFAPLTSSSSLPITRSLTRSVISPPAPKPV